MSKIKKYPELRPSELEVTLATGCIMQCIYLLLFFPLYIACSFFLVWSIRNTKPLGIMLGTVGSLGTTLVWVSASVLSTNNLKKDLELLDSKHSESSEDSE